ncbi:CehA/McbA family metallohydrolase [Paenibacillus campi]|uniref:CehA/McbA family metallohydrolase n=1 Tax=Paenibacillus campi TaxID=3106031 RepID=UPI002AFF6733|nr:CehA/McbA family metallohydrolase [Paenibacillus sp. SGZ-1009]
MTLRWIPAELHTHTFHSDGSQSLQELAQSAKQAGIEVIALTDHNTQSGLVDRDVVEHDIGLRIIAGMEWTTFYGHMVTLGLQQYVDWRQVGQGDIEQGIRHVHEAGGIAGIAHPFRIGSPICTGCYWEYPIHNWSQVDYIEVWSTLMPFMKQDSQRAFALWTALLNEGHRLAATSGRDWHRTLPDDAPAAITYIGLGSVTEEHSQYGSAPGKSKVGSEQLHAHERLNETEQQHTTNEQHANDSDLDSVSVADDPHRTDNAAAIDNPHSITYSASLHRVQDRQYIAAIRSGRLTVTMGPVLDLYAVVHNQAVDQQEDGAGLENIHTSSSLSQLDGSERTIYRIGDTIVGANAQLQLHIRLDRRLRHTQYKLAAQKLRLVIMSDQGVLAETKLDSEQQWQEWTVRIAAPARWLRAELYGCFGDVYGMIAFTNAIYIQAGSAD